MKIIERMIYFSPKGRYNSGAKIIADINRLFHKNFSIETAETQEAFVLGMGFVGREAEFSILKKELSNIEKRHKLVLIKGEQGIGKSRILHYWAETMLQRQAY